MSMSMMNSSMPAENDKKRSVLICERPLCLPPMVDDVPLAASPTMHAVRVWIFSLSLFFHYYFC